VQVVPLALQLLVENAIKHNVVSISNPLVIKIKADAESITIQNPLRPKLSKEKGAGLGIINIKKRYELLTKRPVYFGTEHNNYIVKLPLL
jgi:two-component system LytT family sensor kinase